MAPKLTKARIKKLVNLRRRLQRENKMGERVYHDTSLEHLNTAFRELSRHQRGRVSQRKINRGAELARKAIDAYNKNVAKNRTTVKIHDFITPELFKRKTKEVRAVVKAVKALKTAPRGEVLKSLKDKLRPLVRFRKGKTGEQSISLATATAENKLRIAAGSMTILEEQYYHNFLKATLRTGAFRLYALAVERGHTFAGDLYRRGFGIPEVYLGGDGEDSDEALAEYFSDAQLRRMGIDIDDVSTFPSAAEARKNKQTEFGAALSKEANKLMRRKA